MRYCFILLLSLIIIVSFFTVLIAQDEPEGVVIIPGPDHPVENYIDDDGTQVIDFDPDNNFDPEFDDFESTEDLENN